MASLWPKASTIADCIHVRSGLQSYRVELTSVLVLNDNGEPFLIWQPKSCGMEVKVIKTVNQPAPGAPSRPSAPPDRGVEVPYQWHVHH
jgi:hypothetical protein